jgi:hypothetical protein
MGWIKPLRLCVTGVNLGLYSEALFDTSAH